MKLKHTWHTNVDLWMVTDAAVAEALLAKGIVAAGDAEAVLHCVRDIRRGRKQVAERNQGLRLHLMLENTITHLQNADGTVLVVRRHTAALADGWIAHGMLDTLYTGAQVWHALVSLHGESHLTVAAARPADGVGLALDVFARRVPNTLAVLCYPAFFTVTLACGKKNPGKKNSHSA